MIKKENLTHKESANSSSTVPASKVKTSEEGVAINGSLTPRRLANSFLTVPAPQIKSSDEEKVIKKENFTNEESANSSITVPKSSNSLMTVLLSKKNSLKEEPARGDMETSNYRNKTLKEKTVKKNDETKEKQTGMINAPTKDITEKEKGTKQNLKSSVTITIDGIQNKMKSDKQKPSIIDTLENKKDVKAEKIKNLYIKKELDHTESEPSENMKRLKEIGARKPIVFNSKIKILEKYQVTNYQENINKIKNIIIKQKDVDRKDTRKIEVKNDLILPREIKTVKETQFIPASQKNKRQLSYAFGPETKWRKIENKSIIREIFLKMSRRFLKRKKLKRRKLKENLPSNLNRYHLIKSGQISKEDYDKQCNFKSMHCKNRKPCFIHEGRTNLRKIRIFLIKIKPDHKGWKTGIKWNIDGKGALETMINFRHLREDLLKTKRMINSFNENRIKLPNFIDKIDFYLNKKLKETSSEKKKERKKIGISTRNPKKKQEIQNTNISSSIETLTRRRLKLWKNEMAKDPYLQDKENEIFLEMYRNIEVRKYCEDSMMYFDTTIFPNKELASTLNTFRELYTGLYRWSNDKLLRKLKNKWLIVDSIQKGHVEKLFEKNEIIKKDIEIKGVQPISMEISDHSLLDIEKVDVIKETSDLKKKEESDSPNRKERKFGIKTEIQKIPKSIKIRKNAKRNIPDPIETHKTTDEILDKFFSKKLKHENKILKEKREERKIDPWLTKDYEGKPLLVKSLSCNMNKGYNNNSAYYDKSTDRWIDDTELTHPYIAIQAANINPSSRTTL